MNVFSNFVPNKGTTFDDQDRPWSQRYNGEVSYTKVTRILQQAISEVAVLTTENQRNYNAIAWKLVNLTASSKTYWSILKTFYNNTKYPLKHQ